MPKIDPGFADELKKYGAGDFNACFNCGTCTAACSLTDRNASYPRMFLRHGMLGQKDEILSSREIWLCYACGECSEACPRQAAPGDYMAALRRYAIAGYEPTGLTRLIFKSNPASIVFITLLSVLLGLFLLTLNSGAGVSRWIFEMIPYEVIHGMGLVIFAITGIVVLWSLTVMIFKLSGKQGNDGKEKSSIPDAVRRMVDELAALRRYRSCDTEEDSFWKEKGKIFQPWFIHWSMMWGFIGLLLATVLDFMLKDPATPFWWPSRILGTISGILLVYGSSLAIIYRLRKVTHSYKNTRLADWLFVWSLWTAGITGFWLEVAVAFRTDLLFTHLVFLIHIIVSMELVLLFAFSKFAHAFYRPLALYFYFRQTPLNSK